MPTLNSFKYVRPAIGAKPQFIAITLLCLFIYTDNAISGDSSTTSVANYANRIYAYGIDTRKVLVNVQVNGKKSTKFEKRCILKPIFKKGEPRSYSYPYWRENRSNLQKYPLAHLKQLTAYRVADGSGAILDVRFSYFSISSDDYPNYFVTAPIPAKGCGKLLLFQPNQQITAATRPSGMRKHTEKLEDSDEVLFKELICPQIKNNEGARESNQELCVDYMKSSRFTKKSDISDFYDGREWYLVRGYIYSNVKALVLYRVEKSERLNSPIPIFINNKRGEESLYREYVAAVDLDGDHVNELITKDFGWEWSGFSYLKKEDGIWK